MKNPIEMLKEIKNLLGVELSEEKKTILAQLKLENGTVLEADDFVEGNEVFILTEDERVALPMGEYQLEDGRIKVEQFYPSGQLQQVSFYWNGVGTGTWLKYDEQGNLTAQAEVKNGRPVKVIRFENGITTIIDRKKKSITQVKQ